ncbi:MAG: membrane protein insertase YidC [Nitrospirota bacterium]|nr:MAG: membrane protein insertase YidC [Nitrospirota bacterium]
MEKRVVLFLVLALTIIFGYDLLLKQFGFTPLSESPILDQSEPPPSIESDATSPSSISSPEDPGEKIEQETPPISEPQSSIEQLEIIDTPLYQVKVTNKGAQIKSWTLKNYLTQSEDPAPVDLVYSEGQFAGPLSLRVSDEDLTRQLQEGIFSVEKDFSKLDDSHPTGRLTLTFQSADDAVWVQKELTFHHDSYLVDIVVKSRGVAEDLDVLLGTNFGVVEWGEGFIGLLGPAWMIGDEVEKEVPDDEVRRLGDIRWAALQDKYFISVFIPDDRPSGVFAKTETERVVTAGIQFPGASGPQTRSFRLYAGPKQFDTLKSFQIGLEDTIDFGWFIYGSWGIVKAVAKPLFYVLRYLYDFTHNYGVAIILLTFGIKLLFVPLQYKSYKSMQGMQKIQPKVQEIQKIYKDDRERLNKELMKLYREHKVNPVGGCLPMVLQMPVFVALFNILYMTVDLRQAPFILWISDMSIPDPFYVLPVLMGASMVVQQKIMPTTMDPTQAKMMLMLPVFLTFLFLTFPAGLVLYWLTNNVLTIAQQFITDRYVFKRGAASSKSVEEALKEPKGPASGKPQVPMDKGEGLEESPRLLESKEAKRQKAVEQQRPLVEAVVRELEQLHGEFEVELNQQKDVSEGLLNQANTLYAEIEKLRQEATPEDVENLIKKSHQAFKELKRDIQESHTRQKASRKTLSRKVQKTLDKIHHIPQQQIEEILPNQFQDARQKIKETQDLFTTGLSSHRGDIEQRVASIHEALTLTEEAIGGGK